MLQVVIEAPIINSYDNETAVYTKRCSHNGKYSIHVCKRSAASFAISPVLPNGLTIGTNGRISGTPTMIAVARIYTITATNTTTGSSTRQISITVVNDEIPIIDSYTNGNPSYTFMETIAPNQPNMSGGNPALIDGIPPFSATCIAIRSFAKQFYRDYIWNTSTIEYC